MALASCRARIGDEQLAQDAAQEAFLDAWLNLRQLREPAAFAPWFRRILIKHADRQTRSKRPVSMSPDEIDELGGDAPMPDSAFEADDRARAIRQAVAVLPESLRDVTILFYIEGYSIKEIAAFLDISAAAAKKRLFLARKRLLKKGLAMVTKMKAAKPQPDDDFATQIKFYVALRARDLSAVKALVLQHPELVSVRTVWGVSSDSHYWPIDATPLFWAVATDDELLFAFLVTQGAEVNVGDRHGFTPLHTAVQLRRPAMARLLLDRGATIDATNGRGQTPLILAVLRQSRDMVELLLAAGADASVSDSGGFTAADWARLKDSHDLAALLRDRGVPESRMSAPTAIARPRQTDLLPTGIKIVDLFTPFPRGGQMGLFCPLAGVGVGVLVGQLVQNIVDLYDGHVVYASVEAGGRTAESLDLQWRAELGVSESLLATRMAQFFAPEESDEEERREVIGRALGEANARISQGCEVLLVIDDAICATEGVTTAVRDAALSTENASCTTLWRCDYSAGLEPPQFDFLDGVITFSRVRAKRHLLPAVDPQRSWSRKLREAAPDDRHARIARDVQRTLLRYGDLHGQYEYRGFDSLFYLQDLDADRLVVARARRLDHFLTQSFVGIEPYTGRPGLRVSLDDTLGGCERILAGEVDELHEEAFEFAGSLQDVLEKASGSP